VEQGFARQCSAALRRIGFRRRRGRGHALGRPVARLREEIDAQFAGADNAGRPLLLEGGLKWQALSLSPADMDFAGLKAAAAREIALAFGVPPMLLGLPGDSTYANYREVEVASVDDGVELTGHGLKRRLALEPELRSLIGRST
jgi:hypothetical protein